MAPGPEHSVTLCHPFLSFFQKALPIPSAPPTFSENVFEDAPALSFNVLFI